MIMSTKQKERFFMTQQELCNSFCKQPFCGNAFYQRHNGTREKFMRKEKSRNEISLAAIDTKKVLGLFLLSL